MCPVMDRLWRSKTGRWGPSRPTGSLSMTLPRTAADVLSEHVAFEVERIDRMYLNVYVPQLQHAGGLPGICAAPAGSADHLEQGSGCAATVGPALRSHLAAAVRAA